jgi:hypothetical protein
MNDKEMLNEIKQYNHKHIGQNYEFISFLIKQAEKVERHEQALKFYADENGYVTDVAGMAIEATVMIDKGEWARKVLNSQ